MCGLTEKGLSGWTGLGALTTAAMMLLISIGTAAGPAAMISAASIAGRSGESVCMKGGGGGGGARHDAAAVDDPLWMIVRQDGRGREGRRGHTVKGARFLVHGPHHDRVAAKAGRDDHRAAHAGRALGATARSVVRCKRRHVEGDCQCRDDRRWG